MKSIWFKRLKKEVEELSPHFVFRHIKWGFWRIYWKDHYFHEVFEEMPSNGYSFEAYDPRLEEQSYYEEFEDQPEFVRRIKNFVEGYYDSIGTIRRRFYQLRNDREFFERSHNAYKQAVVK